MYMNDRHFELIFNDFRFNEPNTIDTNYPLIKTIDTTILPEASSLTIYCLV